MPAGTSDMKTIIARPILSDQKAGRAACPTRPAVGQTAQAEQHQADAEHAVHTEQRGVAVGRGHVQALHVVQRDRRVDREAEQTGADHVPEADGDEAQDRPLVRCTQGRLGTLVVASASTPIMASGTTSSAENTAPMAITEVGVPVKYRWCSVPRMPPNRKTMVSRMMALLARAGADQAEAGEQQRNHGGGEHFEEALHPQVDQPPAPVLDHRVVGVLAPGQRGGVEAADAQWPRGRPWRSGRGSRTASSAPATGRGRAASPRTAGRRTAGSARRGPCW
jgi:hypothetical protein